MIIFFRNELIALTALRVSFLQFPSLNYFVLNDFCYIANWFKWCNRLGSRFCVNETSQFLERNNVQMQAATKQKFSSKKELKQYFYHKIKVLGLRLRTFNSLRSFGLTQFLWRDFQTERNILLNHLSFCINICNTFKFSSNRTYITFLSQEKIRPTFSEHFACTYYLIKSLVFCYIISYTFQSANRTAEIAFFLKKKKSRVFSEHFDCTSFLIKLLIFLLQYFL